MKQFTPERLVGELNEIFAEFDHLCLEYGIEKIKTIGDAYMAVGGVPVPDSDHPEKSCKIGNSNARCYFSKIGR